jgi:hypothetical protein
VLLVGINLVFSKCARYIVLCMDYLGENELEACRYQSYFPISSSCEDGFYA